MLKRIARELGHHAPFTAAGAVIGIVVMVIIQLVDAPRDISEALFYTFHPLFFYESSWNFVGFLLMMVLGRKLKHKLLDGDIFFFYIIYYGVGRFFFEGLKIDVWTVGGIPTARWITGIAVIAVIAVMVYRRYRQRRS